MAALPTTSAIRFATRSNRPSLRRTTANSKQPWSALSARPPKTSAKAWPRHPTAFVAPKRNTQKKCSASSSKPPCRRFTRKRAERARRVSPWQDGEPSSWCHAFWERVSCPSAGSFLTPFLRCYSRQAARRCFMRASKSSNWSNASRTTAIPSAFANTACSMSWPQERQALRKPF